MSYIVYVYIAYIYIFSLIESITVVTERLKKFLSLYFDHDSIS